MFVHQTVALGLKLLLRPPGAQEWLDLRRKSGWTIIPAWAGPRQGGAGPGLGRGRARAEAPCTSITRWIPVQPSCLTTPASLAPPQSTMGPLESKSPSVKAGFPGPVPRRSQEGSGPPCHMESELRCPVLCAGLRAGDQAASQSIPPTRPRGRHLVKSKAALKDSKLPITGAVPCLATLCFCR